MRQFMIRSSLVALIVGAAVVVADARRPSHSSSSFDVGVFASGLNDPRGLIFGPDARLYVAEAGTGGTISTAGLCAQVEPPVGPFLGGATARILRFSRTGASAVIADRLPSAEASPAIGGDRSGVASLAFVDDDLLALVSGAGCSHGHSDAANGIYRVRRKGVALFANLSEWLSLNPGAKGAEQPRNPDYEPDGTWYSMLYEKGRLFAVEPNHGLLVSVNPESGEVTLINDLFATFGDNTYTALAADRGDLYVGTLGRIAFGPNGPDPDASFDAAIYRLSRSGATIQVTQGFRAILGLAFDRAHRLYVLQSPIFAPGTGSLVRINHDGSVVPILTGLTFPSALTRGPDDAFYVSVCGYHCAPGQGQILRVQVEH